MSHFAYMSIATLILFSITCLTRALPFVFGRMLSRNPRINMLGRYLPAAILFLLVIYELKIPTLKIFPYGVPQLIALVSVVLIHLWKRNMIISILVGMGVYLLLQWLI